MRRILTFLWIGLLVIGFSMPHTVSASPSHEMSPDGIMSETPQLHAASDVAPGHDCCDKETPGPAAISHACSHGMHCQVVTLPGLAAPLVERLVQPLSYAHATTPLGLSREPDLDLPPPRIG